jgi:hypothetical protein
MGLGDTDDALDTGVGAEARGGATTEAGEVGFFGVVGDTGAEAAALGRESDGAAAGKGIPVADGEIFGVLGALEELGSCGG